MPSSSRTCTMLLPVLIDDMMEISRARLLNHRVSPDAGRCSRNKYGHHKTARTSSVAASALAENASAM